MILKPKKIAMVILILSYHNGFAGTMGSTTNNLFHGFYVGGSIGVSDLQDRAAHSIAPELHHVGGIGITGGGIIGYDFNILEHFNLGVEGFGNATGLNSDILHYDQATGVQDTSETFNNRYNAGVRVLPGYQYNPTTEGHLIFGFSNASFKNNDNGTYGYLNSSFNSNGFQTGMGWKSSVMNPQSLLRLDVLYTRYSGQNSIGTGLAGSGSAFQYYTDTFSTLEADLSLIYKFS